MNYEVIEHPADLQIKVFGKDRKSLFKNSVRAMFDAAGYQGGKKVEPKEFSLEANDLELLLANLLNEALYLSEIHHEVYNQLKIEKFGQEKIKGELIGYELKEVNTIIKGATYHNLKIEHKEQWEAVVLFDI